MNAGFNYDWTKNTIFGAFPEQKVSSAKKKTKEWQYACVNAISSLSNSRTSQGRSTWEKKQINYNLINSIVDKSDFSYVLNPYGMDKAVGNQPAKLRCNNLIANKINRIRGEEMSRPLDFRMFAVNGEAIDRKEEWMFEEVRKLMKQQFWKQLGSSPEAIQAQVEQQIQQIQQSQDPQAEQLIQQIQQQAEQMIQQLEQEASKFQTIEQIKAYAKNSLQDVVEQYATHIYNYLLEEQSLEQKFNDGLLDVLAVSEELFYIGIINGEPIVRKCNSINIDYDRNPDNAKIEDGDWVKEDRFMTRGQILDEFGDLMTDKEVKALDEGNIPSMYGDGMYPGFAYPMEDLRDETFNLYSSKDNSSLTHYVVTHVCWKSFKKIGFLTITDPNTGEELTDIVEDDFKLPSELKPYSLLEWRWIPEVWEGTRIGDNLIIDVHPCENQNRSADNPWKVKLPYVGSVFGSVNSQQTSIVDLLKPFQYLIDVSWFRLEAEMAKAKGKKVAVDTALIDNTGMDMDTWLYHFDNVGILFYNSAQEGIDGNQQAAKYNAMSALDVTMSQSVGQIVQIINKLEMSMDRLTGIGPQMEGQIQPRQSAMSTITNVTNSNYILEPIFYAHNDVKRRVIQQLIETSKYCWEGQKRLSYMTTEYERVTVSMNMDMLFSSDLGVFATNSAREREIMTNLKQLAHTALSTQSATMSDVVKMLKSNSVSEISKDIERSEEKAQERASQAQQQEQEAEMQKLQAQQDFEREKMQFEAEENAKDRQAKLAGEELKALGFSKAEEGEDPAESDKRIIEQGKLANQELSEMNKFMTEQRKLNIEQQKANQEQTLKEKELKLKDKEIQSREKIEKLKAKTALKNPVAGEKKPKK